jgi:hypothetical protein
MNVIVSGCAGWGRAGAATRTRKKGASWSRPVSRSCGKSASVGSKKHGEAAALAVERLKRLACLAGRRPGFHPDWSDEETDDPLVADVLNFYKVEKWARAALRQDARGGSVQPFFILRPSDRNKSMLSPEFWSWFGDIASPKLAHRTESFRKIFTYLDRFDWPIAIIETGCVRDRDNWAGDGQSTILFDKYTEFHSGSVVFSVDRSPQATALCRSLVSDRVRIHTGDSIAWLKSLTDDPPAELRHVDLLYLDSYDVDHNDDLPSAIHHLKELVAISPLLSAGTLVAVDDSPLLFIGVQNQNNNSVNLVRPPRIGGKGRLIAEYAAQIGAEVLFADYQCGWLRIGREFASGSP